MKTGADMRFSSMALIVMLVAMSAAPMIGANREAGDAASGRDPRSDAVTFTNVTSQAGLSTAYGNFLAWGDYDRDGCQDLLIQGSQLFRNNGPPNWDFTDVSSAAGLSGGFTSGTWGDYNNDGWLDFYATGVADKLYRNNGDGTFTDVTLAAGNVSDPYPSTAAGWGDYDRDGFIDLYVANGENWNNGNPIYYPDVLWHNDGDGTFTDVTAAANVSEGNHPYYGRSVAWADFNNDGWLDIYVSNYRLSPNYLYVNDRDGTFTEMGKQLGCAGVWDPSRYHDAAAKQYYGQEYFGPQYGHTIGSAWADINNDGNLDLWTTNLAHKYVGLTGDPSMPYDVRGYLCDDSKMYLNAGAPYYNFTDIRSTSGIPTKPIGGPGTYEGDELFDGVAWGDFDNDGDCDLWIPQVYDLDYAYSFLYEQDGSGVLHWTDRAQQLGLRVYDTYAGVWCDYNNDGQLDLLTAGKAPYVGAGLGTYQLHLFRNGGNSDGWLEVSLTGTECNKAAIGARITVSSGNLTQVHEVEGGMGCHGSQSSLVQHFGFKDRTTADLVEVEWPDGRIERFTDVKLDRILNITESALPVPRISSVAAIPSTIQEDGAVNFSAAASVQGGTISKYEWDFTSDNTYDWESAGPVTASHTYADNGTYDARLRVWSDRGIGVKYGPVVVTVDNLPPVAVAGPDRTVEMDSDTVFNGSASSDTPTDVARGLLYRWDFGDGAFRNWSFTPLADHTYTRPGAVTAELSVRDDDGAEGDAYVNVTVADVVPAVKAMGDRPAMEDETVQFFGSATDTVSDLGKLAYRWDFGDGNATPYGLSAAASHAYTQKGNYTARLFALDPHMLAGNASVAITVLDPAPTCEIAPEDLYRSYAEDAVASYDGTGSDNPSDLQSLLYRWDFGDGNSTDWGPATPASHAYTTQGTFNVTLAVQDDDNDTAESTTTVRITDVPPGCEITTGDQNVQEDQAADLHGSGTDTPSDQNILEYRWNFGDGDRSDWSPAAETEHAYPRAGTYTVSLTVRDDENVSVTSDPAYITVVNVPPVASASASPRNIDEDGSVHFTARASTDTPSDLPGLSFHWTFGDGGEDDGMNVSHVYTKSGSYTVRLRVTDDNGAYSEDTGIRIKVTNVPPTAQAFADQSNAKAGQLVNFTADGNDTPSDLPLLKYTWSFGDGLGAEGQNVSHSYAAGGRYTARLEVKDPEGETASSEVTVDIATAHRPGSAAAGPDLTLRVGLAAAVIIAIAIVVMVVKWRKPSAPKNEGGTDGAASAAPPSRGGPERHGGPPPA